MKRHPLIGENICKPLRSLRMVLPIIRHHHEHWDGSGYPGPAQQGRDTPAGAGSAGRGCLRRAAHGAPLQARAQS